MKGKPADRGGRERQTPRRTDSRFTRVVIAALLAGVTWWAYSSSFRGVFLEGDDQESIVQNPHIRALWPPNVPVSAPQDTTLAGRPVASLTFALNYATSSAEVRDVMSPETNAGADAFYQNVWGYHAFNLLIHLLAGLLVFEVVRLSLLAPAVRDRCGDMAAPLAGCVAGLWLVHPLQTESVTYVVQRVESLMGLFYLLTIYCVIRAANSGFTQHRWTVGAVLACVLGMGTKEVMATAPLMAAAWIWVLWPQVRLRAALPLVAGLAATWFVLAWQGIAGPRAGSVGFHVDGWTPWLYLQTQAEVVVHYLRLAVWPHPLVLEYAWLPPVSWQSALPEMLVLSIGVIGTVAGIVRRRPLALASLWFFLILAPSSSILPIATEVAAEHRMYLPLAGAIAIAVIGCYGLVRRLDVKPGPAISGVAAATLVLVVMLGSQTLARNQDYWSVDAMVDSILAGRPENAHAQLAHAVQLVRESRFAEAEAVLKRALELPLPRGQDERPSRARMHMYLGSALSAQSRLAEGTGQLERALVLDPDLSETYGLLGENYLAQGRTEDAIVALERAIQKLPDVPPLLTRAAWVLATSSHAGVRDGARAVAYAERATQLSRGLDVNAIATLAAAYAEAGQFDRALSAINQAMAAASSLGQTSQLPELRGYLASLSAHHPIRTQAW